MSRLAKPYKKDGWYRTSAGGVPHQKLCRVSEGLRRAHEELAKRLVAGPPTTPVKVADALGLFLEHKKANVRAGTVAWYEDKLRPVAALGHLCVSEVTASHIDRMKVGLLAKRWRSGRAVVEGLAASTVNQHLRAARAFFNWCHRPSRRASLGLGRQPNPACETSLAEESPRRRTVTDAEMAALLAHCRDGSVRGGAQDLREQLLFLRHTAVRPQELRALRWDDVDWSRNMASLPPDRSKTRRERAVPLIDAALDVLRTRRARLESLGLALGGRLVFASWGLVGGRRVAGAGDAPLTCELLAKRVNNLVRRCERLGLLQRVKGGEGLVPYTLRHTRATEMFVHRNESCVVQAAMGHSSPNTTERYKHLASSWVAERVRAMDRESRP